METTAKPRLDILPLVLQSSVSWAIAAILVALVHKSVSVRQPVAGFILSLAVLLIVAFVLSYRSGYGRFRLREALLTGVTWVTLTLSIEIIITLYTAHAWFALLGVPSRSWLRIFLLLAWMFMPAIFAKERAME